MVQEGEIYRIVPLKNRAQAADSSGKQPKNIPEDDQIMLNMVFLKYVTVDELTKVLGEFVGRKRHHVFLRAGQPAIHPG